MHTMKYPLSADNAVEVTIGCVGNITKDVIEVAGV